MPEKKKNTVLTYVIAIAIPLAVGILSALLTRGNMDVYQRVVTPPLSPPSILFPIVWTVLYLLMGISSAVVWQKKDTDPTAADRALSYYAASLAFNFAWSIIFFNFGKYLFAFLWLICLLYLIVRTVLLYRRISPVAAYLQIPYIVWVIFAGYLNFGIWVLNR
ncbi:MAG: tryptophan-rich sensory protein [Clostridia bacterium]|nr:tryptophan-rich sensory protein [Clostridia bacterium]